MKINRSFLFVALIATLAGCIARPLATGTPSPTTTSIPLPTETPTPAPCALPTVIPPTPPAETPGYAQLDPDTGLHVTGKAPEIDWEIYRLLVTGKVDHPLSLTYDELRCMRKVEATAVLICPGFFEDEATWAGTPIEDVLALAGVQEGATGLRLVSADGYSPKVPIDTVLSNGGFLAYEWEGKPLPILHGFPVRAVLPEVTGGQWVKWLVEVEVY